MNLLAPTSDLAARFHRFTRGLVDVIGKYTREHRSAGPLIALICKRLCRRATRFAALVTRFNAGLLPAAHREAGTRAPSERAPHAHAPDPVPRCRGYLLQLGKHEAAFYMGCLEQLVADPCMVALLEASPQARRLLRPLWRMLNPRPIPDVLLPPPRPPSVVPSGPAPTRPAAYPAPSQASQGPPRARHLRLHGVPRFWTGPPIPA